VLRNSTVRFQKAYYKRCNLNLYYTEAKIGREPIVQGAGCERMGATLKKSIKYVVSVHIKGNGYLTFKCIILKYLI
jgi:hypothetical protein